MSADRIGLPKTSREETKWESFLREVPSSLVVDPIWRVTVLKARRRGNDDAPPPRVNPVFPPPPTPPSQEDEGLWTRKERE